jgi:hypothetical protein
LRAGAVSVPKYGKMARAAALRPGMAGPPISGAATEMRPYPYVRCPQHTSCGRCGACLAQPTGRRRDRASAQRPLVLQAPWACPSQRGLNGFATSPKEAARDEQGHQTTVSLPPGFGTEILSWAGPAASQVAPRRCGNTERSSLVHGGASILFACETGTIAQARWSARRGRVGQGPVSVPKLGHRVSEGSRCRSTSAASPGRRAAQRSTTWRK